MDFKKASSKEVVIGTFDRAAASYDRIGPGYFAHFGRRLVEVADIASGAKLLDVATGRGAVLFPAAQQVGPKGRAVGIDISPEMVRETAADALNAGLANIDVRCMDAEALEFPDDSFDWVLSAFSLWFFPRPDRALAEFLRVLRPGGRLGMTTWETNTQYPRRFVQMVQRYLPPQPDQAQAPSRFDTPAELRSAIEAAGFGSIDVQVEEAVLLFQDEEVLWSTLGQAGARRWLDMLGASERDRLKAEIFESVRPVRQRDGIPIKFRVLAAFATKPS